MDQSSRSKLVRDGEKRSVCIKEVIVGQVWSEWMKMVRVDNNRLEWGKVG